jgi:hypothetical protein
MENEKQDGICFSLCRFENNKNIQERSHDKSVEGVAGCIRFSVYLVDSCICAKAAPRAAVAAAG